MGGVQYIGQQGYSREQNRPGPGVAEVRRKIFCLGQDMKKNMKKKLKLTREQKVIRNLLLIAVLTVLLCTIPKTVEYNRTLQELGIEREDLDAEYIWKCEGEYRTIYIEAWKNFGTEHEPDWTKIELQRTNPLLYYGHYQQHVNVADNMISWVMNADLWLDEEGNEYHVWDIVDTIPMLPEIKLIKIRRST